MLFRSWIANPPRLQAVASPQEVHAHERPNYVTLSVPATLVVVMPNLADIDNPYEDQEQEAFVKWLDDNGYPRFRVPNETYTKSHKQRIKNKKLGVSSGVPDLAVVVTNTGTRRVYVETLDSDDSADYDQPISRLVFIEMKRKKGGVTSENQKKWIKTLNEAGIQTVVCKGCDAAIEFIESITK